MGEMGRIRGRWRKNVARACVVGASIAALALAVAAAPGGAQTTPIQHVVVIYQENHSFDNVLGRWCFFRPARHCDGAVRGRTSHGQMVQLGHTPDIVPPEGHTQPEQIRAIDRGRMDGFDLVEHCRTLSCYSQYQPEKDIPTLARLAKRFALSDRTFSNSPIPSFGAHLELVAATDDGFLGQNPIPLGTFPGGPGWGCDSGKVIGWRDPATGSISQEPSCVPFSDGTGTFLTHSPVPHVPTIMDRLDGAGLSWKLYASTGPPRSGTSSIPYGWAICPTFSDCLETPQHTNMVDSSLVVSDAQAGTLPNFSVVLPNNENSQHNWYSMRQGDNWIEQVVHAIMHGPDWLSTTIFITYDDCGCFYDHVRPPAEEGIRVPMVIVGPYARAGSTDHTPATFASLLPSPEPDFALA